MLKSIPSKTLSRRWDHRLNVESKSRTGSTLKSNAVTQSQNKTIALGTAKPTAEAFPWTSVVFNALMPSSHKKLNTEGQEESSLRADKYGGAFELGEALNYCHSAGAPQLVHFLTRHVEQFHNPPYEDWECTLTCGNTSALDMVFRTFCNRDDYVLCEENTYSGTIEALKPLGINTQAIKMDKHGLMPEDLERVLDTWDLSHGPKPFLLYMVPTGHNPTGITQPAERRKAVYAVAEKHDLYIVEDDPYYLLPLGPYENSTGTKSSRISFPRLDEILRTLPPSYLSVDISGRVLRLDSTSKILGPGLRCGWMTASAQIARLMVAHNEVSVVAPSGMSQIMVYKLLSEAWGHEGFSLWLGTLSSQYRIRRDALLAGCEQYLPADICSWEIPEFGMLFFLTVDWHKHPRAQANPDHGSGDNLRAILTIEEAIFKRAAADGVAVAKGSWFRADRNSAETLTFRLTFAAAPRMDLVEGIRRFGDAIKAEFGLI
ncbi:hypothetical protein ABKA04_009282 [Annulohypoxylon sp. FPYF3050]